MDGTRFDRITAELARRVGRRRFVGLVGPAWLTAVLGFAAPADEADAREKKRGRRGGSGHDRNDGRDDNGGSDDPSASAPRKKKKCKGGKKRCAGSCVDTRTDSANCGSCGNACGGGQSCQGGQCAAGCGDGQILCNGSCVASVGGHPCCSQADCGGPVNDVNHISCDLARRQCRCVNTNHGICERTPDKRGICNTCCLGGNPDTCPGDFGCNGWNFCTCPAGYHACPGGSFANRCAENVRPDGTTSDPTVCDVGNSCTDCTQGGTRPYVCCWGRSCVDASGYPPGTEILGDPFCVDCRRCGAGKMCCNKGPGTAPECVAPVNNRCP